MIVVECWQVPVTTPWKGLAVIVEPLCSSLISSASMILVGGMPSGLGYRPSKCLVEEVPIVLSTLVYDMCMCACAIFYNG